MKCPHCGIAFHDRPEYVEVGQDTDGRWFIKSRECSECHRLVLHLGRGRHHALHGGRSGVTDFVEEQMVRPKGSMRPAPPPEVPKEYTEDYVEACVVLPDSPKASAALSRRCLQNILREVAKVKPGNLANEIQQVIDSKTLPSHIVEVIDAVRNIGNFGAHPFKSEKSGEILPVEPGEAEWNLDVLEALYDFYFVAPATTKKKRAALNEKLKQAGKRPMK
jgi:hypothetical protein